MTTLALLLSVPMWLPLGAPPAAPQRAPALTSAPAPQQLAEADYERSRHERRRTHVVEVVEAAAPAVVYIQTDGHVRSRDWLGRLRSRRVNGAGSGVVVLKEGFIVTNHHVIRGANTIAVSFDPKYDDRSYEAAVVNSSPRDDLALLKIEGDGDFPTIPLGTSSDLMIGESVIAIGNPYGQTHTVHQGIISGLHRNVSVPSSHLEFDDLIQTDASINYGNSGGPLLNINGELIGINTAVLPQAEAIGFAIPVDRVEDVLWEELLAPASQPSWLGFEVDAGDDLVVRSVVPGGPAAEAGLAAGDRLLKLGDQDLRTQDEYRVARSGVAPEASAVDLVVEREGVARSLCFPAWDKAEGILYERLGLTVESVTFGRAPYVSPYLRVRRIQPEGTSHELGLRPGDLIEAVKAEGARQAWAPRSQNDLILYLSQYPAGTPVLVDVIRDQNEDGLYVASEETLRGSLTLR